MTQKPQTSIPKRIFSLVLTLLLVCQFIYVPSLKAFAADDDVKKITYHFTHYTYDPKDLFRIEDNLGNSATLPRNYSQSMHINKTGSVKLGDVTVAWNTDAETCYIAQNTTFIAEVSRKSTYYPTVTLTFTSDNYNIAYVSVPNWYSGDNTSGKTATVQINKPDPYNARYARVPISEIQLVLIKGSTVDLGSSSVSFSGLPSSVEYAGGGNMYCSHTPDFTLYCGGKALTKDVDYSVAYRNNYTVGTATVTVTGKGPRGGSLYTGSASTTFRIDKADPSLTPPTGKNLSYNEKAQELVNAGRAYGGSMRYSLDSTNFSYKIPTATEEGTYTVYYFVSGDSNHNSTQVQSVTSTITKPTFTVSFDSNGGSSVSPAEYCLREYRFPADRPHQGTRRVCRMVHF